MENASKALIMAAGVLLGVMIISIGVALFSSLSEYGKQTIQKMEDAKIDEWNSNYLKYYGKIMLDGAKEPAPIQVTAHDIVSVANHARQSNIDNEIQEQLTYNEHSFYVQVDVDKELNFEKKTDQEKNEFLKNNSLIYIGDEVKPKIYKCTRVKISSSTKRVIYIKFEADKDKNK